MPIISYHIISTLLSSISRWQFAGLLICSAGRLSSSRYSLRVGEGVCGCAYLVHTSCLPRAPRPSLASAAILPPSPPSSLIWLFLPLFAVFEFALLSCGGVTVSASSSLLSSAVAVTTAHHFHVFGTKHIDVLFDCLLLRRLCHGLFPLFYVMLSSSEPPPVCLPSLENPTASLLCR